MKNKFLDPKKKISTIFLPQNIREKKRNSMKTLKFLKPHFQQQNTS